jgi:hypothetical protein
LISFFIHPAAALSLTFSTPSIDGREPSIATKILENFSFKPVISHLQFGWNERGHSSKGNRVHGNNHTSGSNTLTQAIYSNNTAFVEQMQYIFDVFWYRAFPARQRIRETEEGIKREFIETIQDPADIKTLVFKLMDSATHEISAIFPTVKTFERYQHEGIVHFLSEVVTQRDISVFFQLKILNRNDKIRS